MRPAVLFDSLFLLGVSTAILFGLGYHPQYWEENNQCEFERLLENKADAKTIAIVRMHDGCFWTVQLTSNKSFDVFLWDPVLSNYFCKRCDFNRVQMVACHDSIDIAYDRLKFCCQLGLSGALAMTLIRRSLQAGA